MTYCGECGVEAAEGAKFCSECGERLADSDGFAGENAEDVHQAPSVEDESGRDWRMAATGVVMGFGIGFLAFWATANIGTVGGWAFLIAWAGGGYYVSQKRTPGEGVGTGLYISALLLALLPITFYIPVAFGDVNGIVAVGSFVALIIWEIVFVVTAVVVGALGYFFKRRAEKQLESA